MENKENMNWWITRCFLKADKGWTDYEALTKTSLSANIDGPCNLENFKTLC